MKLAVFIPAHNEGEGGVEVVISTVAELEADGIDHEVLVTDLPDSPEGLVLYYRLLVSGYPCAIGARFGCGGRTIDDPRVLVMNRAANFATRILFRPGYSDVTRIVAR